jgi:proteasome accessory factor A
MTTKHSGSESGSLSLLPKLCGADIELGNFVLGLERPNGTGELASRALLREIHARYAQSDSLEPFHRSYNPQDWGRKFLSSNGGCAYIDLDHLELCIPEVISAYDHVAAWHAMLRIARGALQAANARLRDGLSIQVLVNNSDGRGNAYGSHLNFLVGRRAWDNLFERKVHHLLYLAAFQVSSIVFTGQGKVGAENGAPPVAFQLSQRADFFETLTGTQTTFRRPIVNARDEPLCGRGRTIPTAGAPTAGAPTAGARLHCIFFDNTLCHVASLLKVGVMQLILTLLEAERVNSELMLDDPVDAVWRWSHDPTLRARARMVSGHRLTAVELQLLFLEQAQCFAAQGGYDGIVPRAGEILALWEDTLLKLKADDVSALASRLDWVLKFRILQRALHKRSDLTWASPEIKHLDHLYSSLDPAHGLYWAYEKLGVTEQVLPEARIEHFVHEPPEDTRAWTRAMLLRMGGEAVHDVDWDLIKFRQTGRGYWPVVRTLHLADPLGFTRAASQPVIEKATSLGEILDTLQASEPDIDATPTLYDHTSLRAWVRSPVATLRLGSAQASGNGGGSGWGRFSEHSEPDARDQTRKTTTYPKGGERT